MKRGFHRSDFTGSEGPGMARLRAANIATGAPTARHKRKGGLAAVKAHMAAADWPSAILAAAKFPELGDEAAAIHRGREAILRPAFQRQLKRDPAAMLEEAKAALIRRFG